MKRAVSVGILVLIGLLTLPPYAAAHETVHTTLSGYQEVPAVSTPGSGEFRMKVDAAGTSVSWTLSYANLPTTVLQAHIHFGQFSVNGGIMVFLCTNLGNGPAGTQACPQEGTITGSFSAADVVGPGAQGIAATEFAEVLAAIRAGIAYANVHTQQFQGGEIRGQLDGPNRP